jgi:hypothetical protein
VIRVIQICMVVNQVDDWPGVMSDSATLHVYWWRTLIPTCSCVDLFVFILLDYD